MAEHNIIYFRNLWQKTISELECYCEEWDKICSDCPIPDDIHGEIRTVIGLARLLMNQKLKQFKGLIDDSEFNTGEKEITCSDLEGFWDMVYYEVEKIQKSFKRLNECKNNDWKFIEEVSEKRIKKVPVKRNTTAVNKRKETAKNQVLASRLRIAELRKKMAVKCKEEKNKNQVDVLLSDKKEPFTNASPEDMNVLNDSTITKESAGKIKADNQVSNDLFEESIELNSPLKQKSAHKKKHSVSNKENVYLSTDSSGLKITPSKQARRARILQQKARPS